MIQLVQRSLPTPEVRGLNPIIGINLYCTFTDRCIEKTKIKITEAGKGPFLKIIWFWWSIAEAQFSTKKVVECEAKSWCKQRSEVFQLNCWHTFVEATQEPLKGHSVLKRSYRTFWELGQQIQCDKIGQKFVTLAHR